jgi:hypothetical protein
MENDKLLIWALVDIVWKWNIWWYVEYAWDISLWYLHINYSVTKKLYHVAMLMGPKLNIDICFVVQNCSYLSCFIWLIVDLSTWLSFFIYLFIYFFENQLTSLQYNYNFFFLLRNQHWKLRHMDKLRTRRRRNNKNRRGRLVGEFGIPEF